MLRGTPAYTRKNHTAPPTCSCISPNLIVLQLNTTETKMLDELDVMFDSTAQNVDNSARELKEYVL